MKRRRRPLHSLLLLSLLSAGALPCVAVAASSNAALLEQGVAAPDSTQAYRSFSQVDPRSPEYKIAFVEMQKIHYREQKWDQFFAFAWYARNVLFRNEAQPALVALEALALLKHCRYDELSKYLIAAEKHAATLPKETREGAEWQPCLLVLKKMERLEALQAAFAAANRAANAPLKAGSADSLFWPLNNGHSRAINQSRVPDPRVLRLHLEPLCKG